jgi:Sec-independent protein translocase protein TatA
MLHNKSDDMTFLGPAEIILIIVIIAIFFFGKDKVLDWAKTFGKAKKEFDDVNKATKIKKQT